MSRDGVDTILLAGTDLTLLFNESNTDFPHVDCAALHIQEILRELAVGAASVGGMQGGLKVKIPILTLQKAQR